MDNRPIGIFDSGAGGLSVLSRIIKLLPQEHYIYFADTLNLPYGSKTQQELIKICTGIFDFFKAKNVKAVIMACNTTSALVYDYVKNKYDFEIYPVIQSVSKCAESWSCRRIGVFATEAAVKSHAYKFWLQHFKPDAEVFECACPKWVSIAEKSLQKEAASIENIKMMTEIMLKNRPDKIILGCTHYPYLLDMLSKAAPRAVFVDPAEPFARYILEDLKEKNMLSDAAIRTPEFYTSGSAEDFEKTSSLFYKVNHAEKVILTAGIMQF